ncbi:MAG: hypothetical protein H0W40_07375, partial [Methylibium sp.]|nr:hypothetical protein [Methylibium sp.]
VLNCVMHRYNLPHVGRIIDMAERMGVDFLELTSTQYHGWAWLNRDALMPTPQDLADAEAVVDASRQRLAGRMKILWISAHALDARPTPGMADASAAFTVIAPDGRVVSSAKATPSAPSQPLRFIPGAARSGNLWLRTDANSHALTDEPAAVESALLEAR